MNKILYFDVPRHRLRTRRLDERKLAEQVAQEARDSGDWVLKAFHGGTVGGGYRHPATTEVALIVANPLGETVVWMSKVRASKTTLGGAAGRIFPFARAIWDGRYSDQAKAKAEQFLQEQHRVHFPRTLYTRIMQDAF